MNMNILGHQFWCSKDKHGFDFYRKEELRASGSFTGAAQTLAWVDAWVELRPRRLKKATLVITDGGQMT